MARGSAHGQLTGRMPSSQSASQQEFDTQTITAAFRRHKQQADSRRASQLAEIAGRREDRVQELEAKIARCRQQHEQAIRQLRQPKVDRLRELLASKRELEERAQTSFVHIQNAFASVLQQLDVAINDRLMDLATGLLDSPCASSLDRGGNRVK